MPSPSVCRREPAGGGDVWSYRRVARLVIIKCGIDIGIIGTALSFPLVVGGTGSGTDFVASARSVRGSFDGEVSRRFFL